MALVHTHCTNCGKSIQVSLSNLQKGKGKYCSRACSNIFRNASTSTSSHNAHLLESQHTSSSEKGTPPLCAQEPKSQFDTRGSAAYLACKRYKRSKPGKNKAQFVPYSHKQPYALNRCPWESGVLGAVRYDPDYLQQPDALLGF